MAYGISFGNKIIVQQYRPLRARSLTRERGVCHIQIGTRESRSEILEQPAGCALDKREREREERFSNASSRGVRWMTKLRAKIWRDDGKSERESERER